MGCWGFCSLFFWKARTDINIVLFALPYYSFDDRQDFIKNVQKAFAAGRDRQNS